MVFSKVVPRPLGMLKQVFLGRFEPVVARFGPWKIPKCLENGPFWDQQCVKNGSKTYFSKNDRGPFMMLKQVVLARFEPVLTEFSPFHHMYAPLCALRTYLRAVWWSHLELGEGCRLCIYISSNLHPSPNSRWLHHTALRYVRRAQSGAYMWWKGLNSVKTGSKWAKNTCLSIPNGLRSLLEKRIFDPFLTHFRSQNGPFLRHFGVFHEPKPVATGSKWAKNTCLSIINGPRSFLEKRIFHPFLTHCWFQNGPFSRHFGIFHGPKPATMGSKRPKNTCLSIPSGLGTTLEKIIFFALGTLVDPPLAPTVRGLAGPPAPPSDHWYGGLRVSLGDSEA